MMKKSNKKGFTLVELIVVIAIMAILAAVLVPTVTNKIKDANAASQATTAENIAKTISLYLAETADPTMTGLGTKLTEAGYAQATVATADKTIKVKQKASDSVEYTITIGDKKATITWTDALKENKTLDVQGVIDTTK